MADEGAGKSVGQALTRAPVMITYPLAFVIGRGLQKLFKAILSSVGVQVTDGILGIIVALIAAAIVSAIILWFDWVGRDEDWDARAWHYRYAYLAFNILILTLGISGFVPASFFKQISS